MDCTEIRVYRENAETIKLLLIDPDTNKGYDLSDTTVKFKVTSSLNDATSYEIEKTATLTDEDAGEFEVALLSTDFASTGDYWYGVFVDDVLVAQARFIVKDSIIV